MMGWYGYMGGVAWYGWLMMLVFWAAVVGLVIWAVRTLFPGSRGGEESADEILNRRYAKGELSRDEYEQARNTLQAGRH